MLTEFKNIDNKKNVCVRAPVLVLVVVYNVHAHIIIVHLLEMNAKLNDPKGRKFYVFGMNQPRAVRTEKTEKRTNNIAHALLHPRI